MLCEYVAMSWWSVLVGLNAVRCRGEVGVELQRPRPHSPHVESADVGVLRAYRKMSWSARRLFFFKVSFSRSVFLGFLVVWFLLRATFWEMVQLLFTHAA